MQSSEDFEGAGIGDSFEYVKGKFETYSANEFYDYRNTIIISPTDGEDGPSSTRTTCDRWSIA